jgi:polyphosphate kinase
MKHGRDHFLNRELSWLEFNARVLEEACNPATPALERVKFLAITASNLDEFFMVRVGGLMEMRKAGKRARDAAGLTPRMQLEAIERESRCMVERQYQCFAELFERVLAGSGLRLLGTDALLPDQEARVREIFHEELYPILTPMVLDGREEGAPAPIIQGLLPYVAVRLAGEGEEGEVLAAIPLTNTVERIVQLPVPEGGTGLLFAEAMVKKYVRNWFPKADVLEAACFRITRNADIAVREDEAPDLISGIADVREAPTEGDCIRLELETGASKAMEKALLKRLGMQLTQVFRVNGPLDLHALMPLASMEGRDELKIDPWAPQPSPAIDPGAPLFEQIARQDLLLYHPYESYSPVVRFVREAAKDPDVLAMKQVLYRTSSDSPIIQALKDAAESGKYVTVLVELKARFDEQRNIEWARLLERSGVQVIYGVKGLKTHAKVCLVIRREKHGMARYVHYGTGNYNEKTARLYSDVSYMTARPALGADASLLFNAICGYSEPTGLSRLVMAPFGLRDRLLELIEAEIYRAKHGMKGRIDAKMNSLVDQAIIEKLYEASQAGVPVNLNVRGICCLRPGVRGLSENIRVVSIVDRYLEHARIFRFRHGGDNLVYISSADWMPRNLDRRVELMVPVDDPACKKRLVEILDTHMKDAVKGWRLDAGGNYSRRSPKNAAAQGSQATLQQMAVDAVEDARKGRPTALEPHLPS